MSKIHPNNVTLQQPTSPFNDHWMNWSYNASTAIHVSYNFTLFQISGTPSSCMRKFNAVPFLVCNIMHVCKYAVRAASHSYWLSTDAPAPTVAVMGNETDQHISRCVVCQAPAPLLTLHSQTSKPEPCPQGWDQVWQGYSFLMVRMIIF